MLAHALQHTYVSKWDACEAYQPACAHQIRERCCYQNYQDKVVGKVGWARPWEAGTQPT